MEIRNELSNLSVWVYCWFAALLLAWLLSFIWLWQFSICCLLFVVPFILFIRWWYKNRMQCTLNHVLKPFLHGFINITLLSILIQIIGEGIIAAIFISTHIIYYSIGYLLYLIVAISFYVITEEVLKLFFSLKSRDSVADPMQITKAHTITATATALGYSMCTGMAWTAFAAHVLDTDNKNQHHQIFGWLFLISFLIAIIGMPMHLITGYVIGCKITKRDIEYREQYESELNANNDNNNGNNSRLSFTSYINVIYTPTFVRSAYIFFLIIGLLVLHFNWFGVFITVLGIVVDYVLLIKHAKNVESELPFDYLQRAGQLNIFGYNVLPDHDPHEHNHQYAAQSNNNINNNINSNDEVQITAVSLNNFSVSADLINKPMVIGSNNNRDQDVSEQQQEDEEDEEEEEEQVDIHVREDILDDDESDSDESTVR